jgi:hypothetical protein
MVKLERYRLNFDFQIRLPLNRFGPASQPIWQGFLQFFSRKGKKEN